MVFCQELGQLLILKALFHKAFKIVTKDAINAQGGTKGGKFDFCKRSIVVPNLDKMLGQALEQPRVSQIRILVLRGDVFSL